MKERFAPGCPGVVSAVAARRRENSTELCSVGFAAMLIVGLLRSAMSANLPPISYSKLRAILFCLAFLTSELKLFRPKRIVPVIANTYA